MPHGKLSSLRKSVREAPPEPLCPSTGEKQACQRHTAPGVLGRQTKYEAYGRHLCNVSNYVAEEYELKTTPKSKEA